MALFLDTNVPVYAAGGPHPLRQPCWEILGLVADRPDSFITDTEVLQEIVHRFLAQHRWPHGNGIFKEFYNLLNPHIEPVLPLDVWRCAELADGSNRADARDLIHIAVMERLGVTEIVSADRGFDDFPAINRIDPAGGVEAVTLVLISSNGMG
jgi:uncharacterized protein